MDLVSLLLDDFLLYLKEEKKDTDILDLPRPRGRSMNESQIENLSRKLLEEFKIGSFSVDLLNSSTMSSLRSSLEMYENGLRADKWYYNTNMTKRILSKMEKNEDLSPFESFYLFRFFQKFNLK